MQDCVGRMPSTNYEYTHFVHCPVGLLVNSIFLGYMVDLLVLLPTTQPLQLRPRLVQKHVIGNKKARNMVIRKSFTEMHFPTAGN